MLTIEQFLRLDLAPMLTACLCAAACAILGNFLLLRRQSLMGDAIAHSVLPGLAAAFLVTAARDSLPMFIGAMVAGLLAAGMSEFVRRIARLDSAAAMGVVFSTLFAAGVLMMSLPRMRLVDLDADCVLNGVLETISWHASKDAGTLAPTTFASLLDPRVLLGAPRPLVSACVVLGLVVLTVGLLYKELRLTSFDAGLGAALGFRPAWVNMVLMALVAMVSVASFEAVGSILVIAMLICPAATARMLTDRLGSQIVVSVFVGVGCAASGYALGAFGPGWLGLGDSVSAAGMIALVCGLALAGAIILAPSHGVLSKLVRQVDLQATIAKEDLLAMLYRLEEIGPTTRVDRDGAIDALGGSFASKLGLRRALRSGGATVVAGKLELTDDGRSIARTIVRAHRLWELYLVKNLGLRADHVHRTAMELEHHTTDLCPELARAAGISPSTPATGPHGEPVP